jgi:hypothetical protein
MRQGMMVGRAGDNTTRGGRRRIQREAIWRKITQQEGGDDNAGS